MPVDAISGLGVGGPEWQIAMPEASPGDAVQPAEAGSSFGGMLADQLGGLQDLQTEAATQSQALATGQAEDASAVVMAVERAQLSMQLAAQLRDKSVESFQEIFRTQV
jgi:flagellar hook-basal body complex protein FliE